MLGACGAAEDWGGLWFGWGLQDAGEMQAQGLQKSLQMSAGWKQLDLPGQLGQGFAGADPSQMLWGRGGGGH